MPHFHLFCELYAVRITRIFMQLYARRLSAISCIHIIRVNSLIIFLAVSISAAVFAQNPYLPLWEHVPDGTPRVFEDPDNPGQYRLYIIGSHDVNFDSYCGPDVRMWSASVEDLNNWRDHGAIFMFQDPATGLWDNMYAPDLIEINRRDGSRSYYLYPHSRGPGREAMVAVSERPDGPFTVINLAPNGRNTLSGSIVGFDPGIFVDYITDPNDLDYDIGFRVYAYWGFRRAFAAELDQSTMYSLRPGTRIIDRFIPSGEVFGQIRDPEGTVFPHVFPGEDLTYFNFFEAAAMSKIGNKYIFTFAGYSGPEYGLGSSTSTMRYAFADSPLGPWRMGGVLVDSRAPVLNQNGIGLMTTGSGHNTHGGLCEVNGQWYVFYHRSPRGFGYARQAMVAPVHIAWDEAPVSQGGRVTITPNGRQLPARAANGLEYTGAEVTSEGFQIYGLDPFRYYSAGIAGFLSNPGTLQDAWDIWDNHQPITHFANGNIAGYNYFGFGGLAEDSRGVRAFEGTRPDETTMFHLYLIPRTDLAMRIHVWLDGPWATPAWGGTSIATIEIPANSPREITGFSVDVSEYVNHLEGKHSIFLVAEGSLGAHCDLIGLGFSTQDRELIRPIPPVVSISLDGEALSLPIHPVRSNSTNGISGFNIYEVNVQVPYGRNIPVLEASASDPSVIINITQPFDAPSGTAIIEFDYMGLVKTYRVVVESTPAFRDPANWGSPRRYNIMRSNPVFTGFARDNGSGAVGFISTGDPPDSVTFSVNINETGYYRMRVQHNSMWGEASHLYTINNSEPFVMVYPARTWGESEVPNELVLFRGINTIRVDYLRGITELDWIELERYLGAVPNIADYADRLPLLFYPDSDPLMPVAYILLTLILICSAYYVFILKRGKV